MCCTSEPTSVPKSASILSAIEASLKDAGPAITFTSPNVLELVHLYHAAQKIFADNGWWTAIDSFLQETQFNVDLERLINYRGSGWPSKNSLAILAEDGVIQMALKLLSFFQNIILKCGSLGVITIFRIPPDCTQNSGWTRWRTSVDGQCIIGTVGPAKEIVVLQHFPALALCPDNVINCTGAGDSLAGSILASLLEEPLTFQDPHLVDKAIHYGQHAAILSLQSSFTVSPKLSVGKFV
jgi:pseudouridine-5'-phosphate glycosidase/pseudouridine kinase